MSQWCCVPDLHLVTLGRCPRQCLTVPGAPSHHAPSLLGHTNLLLPDLPYPRTLESCSRTIRCHSNLSTHPHLRVSAADVTRLQTAAVQPYLPHRSRTPRLPSAQTALDCDTAFLLRHPETVLRVPQHGAAPQSQGSGVDSEAFDSRTGLTSRPRITFATLTSQSADGFGLPCQNDPALLGVSTRQRLLMFSIACYQSSIATALARVLVSRLPT